TGRIRLGVRTKHGMGYLAERPWNDSPQVLNEQGEATAISFDRDLIFKADVYSQNEIEEIATNLSLQLSLLDKFIEADGRRLEPGASDVGRQTDAADGVVTEQERTLAGRHAKQDAEYRELVARSQEETGRATERTQLQQRYAEVTAARKELELRQKERRDREA